jgi:hypothetical protein
MTVVYIVNFCKTVYLTDFCLVFALFASGKPVFCFFYWAGTFLRGVFRWRMKNFSWRKTLLFNNNTLMAKTFLKKYFCSFENGCIFASAFAEKMAVEKSECYLKRMRRKR